MPYDLTVMDTDAYLRRLNYDGPREPTLEVLRALHLKHLEFIPFENLDVQRGQPIVLSLEALFDKLIRRHRGGFCYELNGLFAELLRTLGFQVAHLSARVASEDGSCTSPEYDHLALEVGIEQPWLVDVGFGDAFDEPLPLAEGEWDSAGRRFRLSRRGADWALEREESSGAWRLFYMFSRLPRRMDEFLERCHYHQTSPDSFFCQKLLCTRRTPTGRMTLSQERLILTEEGRREERPVGSPQERERLLRECFGITL